MNSATLTEPSGRPPPESLPPSATPLGFFGRTLAQYTQAFNLDLAALRDASILDVGAGPGSFTAEACRRGIDAVAVDPLYGNSPEILKTRIATSPSPLAGFAGGPEALENGRIAAERFLADYDAHYLHGRYYGAALPLLPFFDRTFDFVLCGNLLFTLTRKQSLEFHLVACRELVRVSRMEARIQPVTGPQGISLPNLKKLRSALASEGIESELVKTRISPPFSSRSMLILRRTIP